MKLVRQPKGSNLCGQACVATIAGITLEESTEVFRTKGYTNTKIVKQALLQLVFRTPDRLKRGKPTGLAIVKFLSPDGRAHWVVWNKKYYDPNAGVFRKVPKYLAGSKQTSFLAVEPI